MHARFGSLGVLLASLLLVAGLAGGAAAGGTSTAGHPFVGSWVVAPAGDDPGLVRDLYLVSADGTVVDQAADGAAGIGSWLADGPQGAVVTMLFPQFDADGGFAGHRVARGSVVVADDGATFSGAFTVELAGGPDGATTGQLGPLSVVGSRIGVEPPAGPVPAPADPLRPDPRSVTDCAGQPVLLDRSLLEFRLTGDCPHVIVDGSSMDVYADAIGTLEVTGSGNDVNAGAVGSATLSGRSNDLVATSVESLVILGNGNDARIRGPVGSLVIDGDRNDVEATSFGPVVSNGRFNEVDLRRWLPGRGRGGPGRPARAQTGLPESAGGTVHILVVTPHPDDFIYGVGGTLLVHADAEIHIVAVSAVQQTAAREVADAFGATIEFLDAPFHRISDHAREVKDRLAEILAARRPTYIFGPPAAGDWTADHTTVGRALLDAADLAHTFAGRSRILRFPIASTTLEFRPNTWVQLPVELANRKVELAEIMTRGLEDEWPHELVRWEVDLGLRYSLDVGWPARHVEGFDAVFAVPFTRLPLAQDLPGEPERAGGKVQALVDGTDLSAGS